MGATDTENRLIVAGGEAAWETGKKGERIKKNQLVVVNVKYSIGNMSKIL